MRGGGPVGETGVVERVEEPVAAAVAGEHAPRAVATVGSRRQPHEKQPRARIAEAGQRPGPVALAGVARRRRGGDRFAMRDEPRAAAAANDAGAKTIERVSVLQSGRIVTR